MSLLNNTVLTTCLARSNLGLRRRIKMYDTRDIKRGADLSSIWAYRILFSVSALVLSSCASTPTAVDLEALEMSTPPENITYANTPNDTSSTNVSQIGDQPRTLSAAQIDSGFDANKLTVEQLRAYADRCSPDALFPPPQGLDCSEVNLRMKRLMRSDDRVTDALVTLDRLGRNNTINDTLEDLKDGKPGGSLNSQAIAGGILDPVAPPAPPPEENLEDILNKNGIDFNAGAFIAAQ